MRILILLINGMNIFEEVKSNPYLFIYARDVMNDTLTLQ